MAKASSTCDVVVVGGGVIGLAVAWRASRRGLGVVVLDRGRPGAATSAIGAGMLAPVSEALLTEQPLLRLGLASVRLYPEFVAALEEAGGGDPGYLRCGTLLVARDGDEAEALERERAMRASLGLEVQRLRASEARRLEPALAPALRLALDIPSDHAIDPRKLTQALVRAIERTGGEVRAPAAVAALTTSHARVTGVRLQDGETLAAGDVVVAAGPWSQQLAGIPDEVRVPIHPVKGQIMRLHDPSGPGLLTRVLRMRTGYVVPRGDGRYVLGATMEERGFDATVTAGAVYELLRDASELLPGIAELAIDELSAGFRPATPDNAPAIGPGALPGLHWATGHYRHGILLAPVTAELVADALTGDGVTEPELTESFAPTRFTAVAA